MSSFTALILYSFFSGITVFLGGLVSWYYSHKISTIFKHFLGAFAGGIMIAAVSFVLIPEGIKPLYLWEIIALFSFGGVFFFYLDKKIEKKGGDLAYLLAMLLDFFPEALVLGATFATDPSLGILLALFIGLQNFPEAFNSFDGLVKSGFSSQKALVILFFLSFTGVVGAVLGSFFLQDLPKLTGALMVFSSSGILYLIFQDIAPSISIKNSWFPALGVNFGFLLGMICQRIIV